MRVGIPNPPGSAVMTLEQALNVAQEIGYPVLVRPSYVLGGRAMEIVQNASELVRYMTSAFEAGLGRRVLIDKYFEGREVEVDAVCDGETVLIPGIMEHVERAGVHSGDSMAIYPGLTLSGGRGQYHRGLHHADRSGARGEGADEYPVRGGRRACVPQPEVGHCNSAERYPSVRHRGQPTLQPHDTVHLQGDRGSRWSDWRSR